jgi:hypothetical protein
MAARVVDFPLPVGPVTTTNPLGLSANVSRILGNPKSLRFGTSNGMTRMAAPKAPRCLYAFTLKRPIPESPMEKSTCPSSSKTCLLSLLIMDITRRSVSLAERRLKSSSIALSLPVTLNIGGSPTVICKSDAPLSTAAFNRSSNPIIQIPLSLLEQRILSPALPCWLCLARP